MRQLHQDRRQDIRRLVEHLGIHRNVRERRPRKRRLVRQRLRHLLILRQGHRRLGAFEYQRLERLLLLQRHRPHIHRDIKRRTLAHPRLMAQRFFCPENRPHDRQARQSRRRPMGRQRRRPPKTFWQAHRHPRHIALASRRSTRNH